MAFWISISFQKIRWNYFSELSLTFLVKEYILRKIKKYSYPATSHEVSEGDGTLGFHPHFDIRHNWDSRVARCTSRPHLPPRKIRRVTECGKKTDVTWKFAMILSEIEPRNSRVLVHYLVQEQHHSLRIYIVRFRTHNAIPLQVWSGPEGSRKLRFSYFMTTAHEGGKVLSLTHRPHLPPGNPYGTHFW
jgi:hypothetical protein